MDKGVTMIKLKNNYAYIDIKYFVWGNCSTYGINLKHTFILGIIKSVTLKISY